jgi:hypothetical protein
MGVGREREIGRSRGQKLLQWVEKEKSEREALAVRNKFPLLSCLMIMGCF